MRAGDGLFALDLVHGVFDFSALFIDREDASYGEGFNGLSGTGAAAVDVKCEGIPDVEKCPGQDKSFNDALDERSRTHGDWILAETLEVLLSSRVGSRI